jgi:phospholipid-binding lipoprotein MlaA
MWGVNFVSTRARYLGATDLLEAAALDQYSFVRDAYLARRRSRLTEGKDEPLPDYDSNASPSGRRADNATAGAAKGQ